MRPTGRENEANGLYYYRARYYSPLLGRFISQDPLGFAAGVNSYAYVSDSPTNLKDATGLGGGVPVPSEIFAGRKENQKWWKDFWHAFWYEPYSSKYTCRTYPESWCIGNEKRLGQIGIVPHYDTMILAAPAVAAVDEVVGEEAADLAGTAIADGSVEGAHDVALFHQGNLGEGVSAGRSLSTSFDSDLAHYHPEGQLYTFRVPEEVTMSGSAGVLCRSPRLSQHSFDYLFAGDHSSYCKLLAFDRFANEPIGKPPEFAPEEWSRFNSICLAWCRVLCFCKNTG